MNTPARLEQDGATCAVNHVNHREYVLNGHRYFFGWDSTIDDKTGNVHGWILYQTTKEA